MIPKLAHVMRAASSGILAGVLLLVSGAASAQPALDADVLIQAGTGTPGVAAWTSAVADEATSALRGSGLVVIRAANLAGKHMRVRDAVFVQFGSSVRPCSTTAGVGYPDSAYGWMNGAKSKRAARVWRGLYARRFPYGLERDNFTDELRQYDGFRHVTVADAALVIDGGEITCPQQHAWLQNRLQWEGDLIAYFVSVRVGRGKLPKPPI